MPTLSFLRNIAVVSVNGHSMCVLVSVVLSSPTSTARMFVCARVWPCCLSRECARLYYLICAYMKFSRELCVCLFVLVSDRRKRECEYVSVINAEMISHSR